MITLVLGGTRSGKSTFAESYCLSKDSTPAYIATSYVYDGEMEHRVELHKSRRVNQWVDYEAPLEVSALLKKIGTNHQAILLDCLTMLITNYMLKDFPESIDSPDPSFFKVKEREILEELESILAVLPKETELVIVSSEVGLGIVPENVLSRAFRDINGTMNQFLAEKAERVIISYAGIPLQIKPSLERIQI